MHDEFKVGEFRIAVKLNRISQNGHSTRVEPKVMQVLTCLAERPGEVLSKDVLMRAVWTDTNVTDDVLTGCISTLRKVFRDSAREPSFIETIPKGGYRLIAPVDFGNGNGAAVLERASGSSQAPPARSKVPRGMITLAVLVFVAAAAWVFSRVERPAIDSVAILPFSNSNADTEYLSDGISESIIDSVSQLPNLRVMSWSAVSRYKGQATDPLKVGRELGVGAVLTGQIVQRDDQVMIQTELVDLRRGTQLWGAQYDRKSADLILLQEDIARQISEKLRLRLTGEDERKLSRNTTDPEAYRMYLKGRYFWNKRSEDGLRKAIAYFQQAIDRDPAYARAYSGLADSYDLLDDWGTTPPRESFPKARAAALKALELDDSLAEAHTSLAFVKANYDWDLAAGEKEFKRAMALDPNYATAHQWYAMHLAALERFPEAEAEMQRAVELDPLSVIITMGIAEIDDYERKYDAAEVQYRKTLELDPNFVGAHGNLSAIYEKEGKYKEAVQEAQKAARLSGEFAVATELGKVFAKSGYPGVERYRLEKYLRERAEGKYVPALGLAQLYFIMGNKDAGVEWVEKAYDERDSGTVYLNVYSEFDSVRDDPRFREMVKKVGLPSH